MKRTLLFSNSSLFITSFCPFFSWQCCPEGKAAPLFFPMPTFMLHVWTETVPHQPSSCLQSTHELSISTVFFCPFPGCIHLFWPWVTGFSIRECPNPLEWRVLLKDKQMLKSMEKRQRTVRHYDCHVVKCSHLGSMCVPHPLQCQVGPPLWLQKLSFIPSFISHYNALGSWTRSFSATQLTR